MHLFRHSQFSRLQINRKLPYSLKIWSRTLLLTSAIAMAALTVVKHMGLLEPLELASYDAFSRRQAGLPDDSRLLIVGVTEEDLQQYGWPLPDDVLAQAIETLQSHNPRVLGLDLYRSALTIDSQRLSDQLQADNLIAVMNVGNNPPEGEVPPPPIVPWERVGFNDVVIDGDGTLRRGLLFVGSQDERSFYAFSLRLALRYLAADSLSVQATQRALVIGDAEIPAIPNNFGAYQTIDDRGYQILLRYRSDQSPAPELSLSQVLSNRFDPALVSDRIVVLGSAAASLKDQFYTPFNTWRSRNFSMSGVVIHAQMVSQLLDILEGDRALYQSLPNWAELVWLLAWLAIASQIAWILNRPVLLGLGTGGVMVILWGVSAAAFSQLIWLPLAEPALGIIMASGAVVLQKLLYRSTHDELTGLPSRELFVAYVGRALSRWRTKQKTPVTVAFLDIDRFKLINQSWGHTTGDRILTTLVQRLQTVLPPSAHLSRVGGDEFALLFERMPQADIDTLLYSVQAALARPFMVDRQRFSVTTSIGMALTQTGQTYAPEDLLRDAHTAMYRAKTLGNARHQLFASGMLAEAKRRLNLENDLQDALKAQAFTLYYQPIICFQTGKLSGFEALLRWRQPNGEFLPPAEFVPVAEEIGLITTIGSWVFQSACEQLKRWQQQFTGLNITLSINLSRRQLEQPDLVEKIGHVLSTVGLDGHCIRLEITESVVMVNPEETIQTMVRLKDLGIQLSIDDFGTGYSSLSLLHRFPMDSLKVDRSFVSRMDRSHEDLEIVKTVIALGHKLGFSIVAEGIEQHAQLALLQQVNCDYGQGYLFAPPLSHEQAVNLLTSCPTWC
ncbi:MAG: EAL domain-containing protein [Cyanobacteria bacterium P01_H01_bin.119]